MTETTAPRTIEERVQALEDATGQITKGLEALHTILTQMGDGYTVVEQRDQVAEQFGAFKAKTQAERKKVKP